MEGVGRPRAHGLRPARRTRNLLWAGFFFVLGLIGLLIPIVPQIPFFVMSLLFLSLVFRPVRLRLRRFLHRHPRLAHTYRNWRGGRRRKRQDRLRRRRKPDQPGPALKKPSVAPGVESSEPKSSRE
jgi:hypothetical protein